MIEFYECANYRGPLQVKEEGGHFFWRVDCDFEELPWSEIPGDLCAALKKYHDDTAEWRKPAPCTTTMDPSADFEIALFFHEEELTYPGYKRVSVKSSKKNWKKLKNGSLANKVPIDFPITQVSSHKFEDRATHFAVMSKGGRIFSGPLKFSIALDIQGIIPRFSAGALVIKPEKKRKTT